ncbi:translocation/assembly module TamB domain-containing protein [Acidiphilium sp. PA]|uniref:translocation/assembly module TamB domain-containing protein n=1 Tax=Acidiphilium sp. PA TaxID=2871705 RepID=UPI00224350D9|nr:translocation/assembly module TamB domain-containing protein [Acidiphilium sp. PA]MCW8307383.1 translocation/assembly module TamB domain-containing protein [Acidiphilium sp. PA]
MRRALKIIGIIIAILIALPIVAVIALDITLNTGAGRSFAASKIDRLTGGEVKITGLSGHFPKYIAARRISIADAKGTYLTIDNIVLRWSPFALLHRAADVQNLTAQSIDLTRLPVASKTKPKSKSSTGIPIKSAIIDHLAIAHLAIGKPVIGHAIALRLRGHAVATSLTHIQLALAATSLDQPGQYDIHTTVDPQTVAAKIALHEPQGGLIESLSGIAANKSLAGPLDVTLGLNGPRHTAALDLTASLGALHASATGTVDLSRTAPGGDVTLTIPEIAPYAALGHRQLTGRNVLHLTAKKSGTATNIHLNDAVEITNGAKPIPALVGKRATIAGDITLDQGTTTIHRLTIDAAAITAKLAGMIDAKTIALHGRLTQPDIALIDPQLAGHVSEHLKLNGPRTDFALDTKIAGVITTRAIKSGPFNLAIAMTNLPKTPKGSITGTGSLDDAPLAINADFARSAAGDLDVALHQLSWKSLTGHGTITRAAGARLPDGNLHLAITKLADFGQLLNIAVAGSIDADFAHTQGQPATIKLTAANIAEGRSIGVTKAIIAASLDHIETTPALDASATITGLRAPSVAGGLDLAAKGTETALDVKARAAFSNLAGKPANLTLAGVLDGKDRTVHLATLTAAARGVTARLLGPATIIAKPGLEIHHLALGLGGLGGNARITANGRIKPTLDLTAAIQNLPAALARAADPKLTAHGTINANAHITRSLTAPTGTVQLTGRNLGVATGPGAGLPAANLTANETLLGHAMRGTIAATLGAARLNLTGTAPLSMTGPMALTASLTNVSATLVHAVDPKLDARGTINAHAKLVGTPRAPRGTIDLTARGMRLLNGTTASLPAADLIAHETLSGTSARGTAHLTLGRSANLDINGTVPLTRTGAIALAVTGRTDLRLVDPITEAQGTRITGILTPDLRIGGTAAAPQASGRITLAGASVENITSGLDLTKIDALVTAAGQTITLDHLSAQAGKGTITGQGTIGLQPPMPVNLRIAFDNASPVSSDIITESLGGAVAISGAVKTALNLGGTIDINSANIEIPKGLPPSVTTLKIIRPGVKPPPPPAPAPPIGLALNIVAKNQVFIRGDGIFANLGGALHLAGTAAHPIPSGGFHLIRGSFNLGGKNLKFTKGTIDFNGGGFMPQLDLEASNTAADGTTSTLAVTGTPTNPKIGLSSSPTLPSDEVLAHLLYGTGTQSLSAFQAVSLAASLAQLAGIGGGGSGPLGGVRKALGLDELSLGGGANGSAAPTINAGRYVAPGVYVGAQQSASGQGSTAKVEINLYKGLKLDTKVGTGGGAASDNGESIGLKYQFNY